MSQTDLDFGIKKGVVGINRAALNANSKIAGWTGIAKLAVLNHLASLNLDSTFTIEDVRVIVDEQIPPPPDLRSWGSVTQSLIKTGDIQKTFTYKQAASSNGSPKMLYKKGIS